jgi:hypothetical protein
MTASTSRRHAEPRTREPRYTTMRDSTHLVHCSQCRQERPDWWPLSWWLASHVVCEHHSLTPSLRRGTRRASPQQLAAVQRDVLRVAAGDGSAVGWTEPNTFMADLTIMSSNWGTQPVTADSLISSARHLLRRPGRRARVDPQYADAIRHRVYGSRTSYDLGYPWGDPTRSRLILDLAGLPDPPMYAILVRYRETPRQRLTGVPLEPRFYPELLPTDIYLNHLALLCDELPINRGRWLAAAAVWLITVGPPWGYGYTRTTSFRPLARLQATMEQAGRFDAFWDAITAAAMTMAQSPIDYAARRRRLTAETVRRITEFLPNHPPAQIRLWLHLHWVCHRPKDCAEDTDLMDFHRDHGAALFAAAHQHETTASEPASGKATA